MCQSSKQLEKMGKIQVPILVHETLATNVYRLVLTVPKDYTTCEAGQFVNVYLTDGGKLLPRPISICEVDSDLGTLTLVYAVLGGGTKVLASYQAGTLLTILGPFGHGFTLQEKGTKLLIGGGVGTPPLVELAKRLTGEVIAVVGFRTEPYLIQELERYAKVYVATDDGSVGHHGTVLDCIEAHDIKADVIYSCGPKPMLEGVQTYAKNFGIQAQLSLEERMGCGFGACVGCVVKVVSVTDLSKAYSYKKVCYDGPVFDAREVIL